MTSGSLLGIPEMTWWYPIIAFILLSIALLTIPRKDLKSLFFESLMWGFVLSLAFMAAMNALHFFRYVHQGPFSFLGASSWLALAWSPAIMVFLYFKPPSNKPLRFWSYLLAFSLLSAVLDAVLHEMGLLRYYRWSPLARFCAAFVWFWASAYVHERYFSRQP
ncbi:MAG: hypothetical protein ACM3ZC_11925 [Bacteroidota bacterium]